MKFQSVTIPMKAIEQYFPVVLLIMLYKVVLILSLWMKSSVSTQMKATEQYFPVVMFIMLYKVVLTFESVDEIWKCGHSNGSCCAVLSVKLFITLCKAVLTFESVAEIFM